MVMGVNKLIVNNLFVMLGVYFKHQFYLHKSKIYNLKKLTKTGNWTGHHLTSSKN